MGATESVLDSPVFDPILKELSDPLSVVELWDLPIPDCARDIDLTDVAVLLAMDNNKDGMFSKREIIAFAEIFNKTARDTPDERKCANQILGSCTCDLVHLLQAADGIRSMSQPL
jgi:hypothetical protein